jgi:DsbC/DsbD-like thiol-disulfide interchange protein
MALALSEYLDTTETASKSPRSLSPATGISPESAVVLAKGTKDEKPKSTKKGQAKPAVVTGQVFLSVDRLPAGKTCKVLVQLQIAEGWHIHANPAGDPDSDIATEVELEESKLGIELKSLKYPKGKSVERGPGEKPQILLTGKVNVIGQLEIPANAAGREEELVVTVMHQACDDKQCLAPKPLKLRVPVKVARPDEPVKAINESLFAPPAKKK